MFETVFIIWGVGMLGFTIFSIKTKPKNKHGCYDLSKRVVRGKKFTENVNKRSKSNFK